MSFSSFDSPAISPATLSPMSYSPDSSFFEFNALRPTTVTLSEAEIDWAIQAGQAIAPDPVQQWQGFLAAMGLKGFQRWLESGALDIALYHDAQPFIPGGVQCQVRDLRLCLAVQGSVSDAEISIPATTLTSERFAHLYVLVEVEDETNQVTILKGLRRDRLLAYQQQRQREPLSSGMVTLPVTWFDTTPEDILLYLNYLNPEMLNPEISEPTSVASLTPSSTDLSPTRSDPDRPANLAPAGSGALINVGRWLRDQIDTVADELAWTLMPPLAPGNALMGLRSPTETLEDILTELAPQVAVPETARGAYTDFQPYGLPFRLYALTWTLFESDEPEWSLLLCLGPQNGGHLPPGTHLIVRDQTSVLVDQVLTAEAESTYLYAQVIGHWDEQFTASVQLPNGSTLNWPPFAFRLQAEG
jgi:hypothetical protein